MATIAVYSLKGGVGKTTTAVTLAACAVAISRRRTLLWDLDAQAAATWLTAADDSARDAASAVFARDVAPDKLIRASRLAGLDLLGADVSLRGLDQLLFTIGKRRRLAKLIEGLGKRYDRIILDCPPGLTETAEQAMRAADIIVVPVIPSPLSQRALEEVMQYLTREARPRGPVLPIFTMVDRRRALHRAALDAHPNWPVVPMASAIEAMAVSRVPVITAAPESPGALAYRTLWSAIERKLAEG